MRSLYIKRNLINIEMRANEEIHIIDFLNTLDPSKKYSLIDVASGLCLFVEKIKAIFRNFEISCLEINHDMAELARNKGFMTYNESILKNSIKNDSYDIVHCSHLIEHFGYPEIRVVINELLRITKSGGYCIIRSPLMWENFYYDLDHVRPYPPQAIMNYLTNPQQQVKGNCKVEVIKVWYRTIPKKYKFLTSNSLLYGLKPLRGLFNSLIKYMNKAFEKMWNRYRFPSSEPNGYVLILKKIGTTTV